MHYGSIDVFLIPLKHMKNFENKKKMGFPLVVKKSFILKCGFHIVQLFHLQLFRRHKINQKFHLKLQIFIFFRIYFVRTNPTELYGDLYVKTNDSKLPCLVYGVWTEFHPNKNKSQNILRKSIGIKRCEI